MYVKIKMQWHFLFEKFPWDFSMPQIHSNKHQGRNLGVLRGGSEEPLKNQCIVGSKRHQILTQRQTAAFNYRLKIISLHCALILQQWVWNKTECTKVKLNQPTRPHSLTDSSPPAVTHSKMAAEVDSPSHQENKWSETTNPDFFKLSSVLTSYRRHLHLTLIFFFFAVPPSSCSDYTEHH